MKTQQITVKAMIVLKLKNMNIKANETIGGAGPSREESRWAPASGTCPTGPPWGGEQKLVLLLLVVVVVVTNNVVSGTSKAIWLLVLSLVVVVFLLLLFLLVVVVVEVVVFKWYLSHRASWASGRIIS